MNNADRILARINADCDEEIKALKKTAELEDDALKASYEKKAKKRKDEIAAKAEKKVAQINASSKSRCELEVRNAVLRTKRAEIDKTVGSIASYLYSLSDEEYFAFVLKLASRLNGSKGVIKFNQKDLNRMPSDFVGKLRDAGVDVEIDSQPIDIDGGFILKDGDIEENMSFSAIISAKRDELEDYINRALFAE